MVGQPSITFFDRSNQRQAANFEKLTDGYAVIQDSGVS
jgi:hypothetical protein